MKKWRRKEEGREKREKREKRGGCSTWGRGEVVYVCLLGERSRKEPATAGVCVSHLFS
jgi:hypothetical protein